MEVKRNGFRVWVGMAVGVVVGLGFVGMAAAGDATSFVAPDEWGVGDSFSTYQEWDVFESSSGNPPDVGYVAVPTVEDSPTCGALPPGFISSSNNFYAFGGDYIVEAEILNHGAAAPAGYGTIVWVQTASTENPDFEEGVIVDSVRLLDSDGAGIPGGANEEQCRSVLLYSGTTGSPWGDVIQDEWLFVFWLPGYTGDFKVVVECHVHATFSALRVDTLNAETPFCDAPDIDCNCRVEAEDALRVMANLAGPDVYVAPAGGDAGEFERADLNFDGDVDLSDYAQFQRSFPY